MYMWWNSTASRQTTRWPNCNMTVVNVIVE
jgi:hypothetical protein